WRKARAQNYRLTRQRRCKGDYVWSRHVVGRQQRFAQGDAVGTGIGDQRGGARGVAVDRVVRRRNDEGIGGGGHGEKAWAGGQECRNDPMNDKSATRHLYPPTLKSVWAEPKQRMRRCGLPEAGPTWGDASPFSRARHRTPT